MFFSITTIYLIIFEEVDFRIFTFSFKTKMEYLNFMCFWLCFTGCNLCYYMTPVFQLVSVLISCIFQTPQMMGICCVPAKMTKAHVKMKCAGEIIVFITG